MLTAMNAAMCSRCFVTEPWVKSFIWSRFSLEQLLLIHHSASVRQELLGVARSNAVSPFTFGEGFTKPNRRAPNLVLAALA